MATVNRPLARIRLDQPADFSNKHVVKRLSPAAVKAFLRIATLWELRDEDARLLLGGISNGGYYELKKARSKRGSLCSQAFLRHSIFCIARSLPIDGFGFQIRTQCLAESPRLPT
jgi:hypothetical protein